MVCFHDIVAQGNLWVHGLSLHGNTHIVPGTLGKLYDVRYKWENFDSYNRVHDLTASVAILHDAAF